MPSGLCPEVKSFIEFLFMLLQIASQHVPLTAILVIDLRADAGDGDGDIHPVTDDGEGAMLDSAPFFECDGD